MVEKDLDTGIERSELLPPVQLCGVKALPK
jgi:hypothetical protein